MCVLDPLKVTFVNYEGTEEIEASYYPHDVPKEGSRKLPFSKEIYIDRGDFAENPPKGYYRLTPKQSVRLKHAYIITCKEVIKDAEGTIIEVKAAYHPDSKSGSDTSGIKVKSAIQWVEAKTAKQVEVRLYDRLFREESPEGAEDINPDSLTIVHHALIEPAAITGKPNVRFQFEREGYFYADPIDSTDEAPVFNKIVGLKDSWAKQKKASKDTQESHIKKEQIDGEVIPMSQEEHVLFDTYIDAHALNQEIANTLARDARLSRWYAEALSVYSHPTGIANMVVNEVARELKQSQENELKFDPKQVAELVQMIDEEIISSKIAKQVFEAMTKQGENPRQIVEAKGLVQISDPAEILPILEEIMASHPENVSKFKAGNTKLLGFFVGQVLKATGGKANPKVVNELVAIALR
jgi:glutaminyl-tRNA synthetase